MTSKAKTEKIEKTKTKKTGNQPGVTVEETRAIEVNLIVPSPLEPQQRRRERFKKEELEALAQSILEDGLISPITVRPVGEQFEIVAGERRWLAHNIAALTHISCIVRELSDAAALRVQLKENLERKDIHPMDEALWYKHLYEALGFKKEKDLADHLGRELKHVVERLKLNNLILEIQKAFENNEILVGHATEIAKFSPDLQPEIFNLCFDTSWTPQGWQPDRAKPLPVKSLLQSIQSKILLQLSRAPFDTKAQNLRDDQLACVKCPERTGAKNLLFEGYHEKGNDRCLNQICFGNKTNRFVQLTRETATADLLASSECPEGYKIPVIAWSSSNKPKLEDLFPGEVILSDGDYIDVSGNECEKAVTGIFLDSPGGWRFARQINICRDKNCEKHAARHSNSHSSGNAADPDADRKQKLKRKQEIFDVKIGEAVRREVLKQSALTFSAEKQVFHDEKWLVLLLARLWDRIDSNARELITEALGKPKYGIDNYFRTREATIEYFTQKLTADERARMLFLCIVANDCEMLYGNWADQGKTKDLAAEFGVDYVKLDASERLTKSPKKYFSLAQEYFNKIENGEKADKPIFYKIEE